MIFFWKRRSTEGKEEAVRARESAERRRARAEEEVIIPLREMRERNHVADMINFLIHQGPQAGRP